MTIDNSKQFDVFDTIRDMIRTDSVLSSRFSKDQFHLFEPNMKGLSSKDYPYITISVPELDTTNISFDHSTIENDYTIPIEMVLEFKAKDKSLDYMNRLQNAIQSNESSLNDKGFNIINLSFTGSSDDYIKERHSIRLSFSLELRGAVEYG